MTKRYTSTYKDLQISIEFETSENGEHVYDSGLTYRAIPLVEGSEDWSTRAFTTATGLPLIGTFLREDADDPACCVDLYDVAVVQADGTLTPWNPGGSFVTFEHTFLVCEESVAPELILPYADFLIAQRGRTTTDKFLKLAGLTDVTENEDENG